MRSLSLRQRLFVELYLGNRGNATNAAREAGYKHPEHNSHRLMENDVVRREINRRVEQHAMPREEVLIRLTAIARGDMGDYIRITKTGFTLALRRARRVGKTHVIRRLKKDKHGYSIELLDPLRALELLGRYYGLWNRHERALRRQFLGIIKRKIDGKELPFTLADLVAAAEERAVQRRQERAHGTDGGDGGDHGGGTDCPAARTAADNRSGCQ